MQPDDSDKIVITADDLAEADSPETSQSRRRSPIPLWWRVLSILLVLCPPALFLGTIAGMVAVRRRSLSQRYAHAFHYCILLLTSGFLLTLLVVGMAILSPESRTEPAFEMSAVAVADFPALPADTPLTGREVASELSPLVVVIEPLGERLFDAIVRSCGAGAIVLAARDGMLIVTSRHVVEFIGRGEGVGEEAGITLHDGQRTRGVVVGLHKTLDLALLWVKRNGGEKEFMQPLRSFESVEIGEEVFVIGHPQGLEFSLSNGLVAQVRGPDMIQVSAPVSPGNSGGPVFDSNGRLMAVIQGVVDKTRSPNAENLNFAVRVDDLLNINEWTLEKEGRDGIAALASAAGTGPKVSNGSETATEEASISYRR